VSEAPTTPEPDASSPPAPPGPVSLRVSTGPLAEAVLNRVASMVLARAQCPLDRFDDALILCDAISAHAPAHVRDDHLAYTLTARERAIELRVAELRKGGAAELMNDAVLPDVGNVIERYSEHRRVEPAADDGGEELILTIPFA
jgi:serine/threonine-protein kinase RsbW